MALRSQSIPPRHSGSPSLSRIPEFDRWSSVLSLSKGAAMSTTQSPPSTDRPRGTVGWRARFGVIIPSTNTAVERDYNLIRPDGVTYHTARMWIQPSVGSDKEAEEALQQLRDAIDTAIRDVVTCHPDHLIAGMSSETFMGGLEGNERFTKRAEELSGLSVKI